MSRRAGAGSRSGSGRPGGAALKLMKFSNTSISSARASYARHEQTNPSDEGSEECSQFLNRRRKFFDDSTGLGYVFSRIVTYVCRQVTTTDFIHHRLAVYSGLVLVGGILNEFASSLLRWLQISSQSLVNQMLVRAGWAVHCCLLFALMLLSSRSAIAADQVQFDEIEQSFEQYFERKRNSNNQQNQQQQTRRRQSTGYNPAPAGQPGQSTVVSLQEIAQIENASQHFESELIKSSKRSNKEADRDSQLSWVLSKFWVPDLWRLVACNLIYIVSMTLFFNIRSMTRGPGGSTGKQSAASSGRVTAMQSAGKAGSESVGVGLQSVDISGHIFMLTFSNLVFFEECNVMCGWEQMAERLSELYKEYVKIGAQESTIANNLGTFSGLPSSSWLSTMSAAWRNNGIVLCRAQLVCRNDRPMLKASFFVGTLYSVCRDLMIFQTAFFYHTIFEKIAALVWAILCWYTSYRVLFPWLQLGVKRLKVQGLTAAGASSATNNQNNPGNNATGQSTCRQRT